MRQPTSDKHAVNLNEFHLASYLRLGISLPLGDGLKHVIVEGIWIEMDIIV